MKNAFGITGVIELMESVGENFDRTAKLLRSKGGMQNKEDLDHFNRAIGIFFNCTHPVRFSYSSSDSIQFEMKRFGSCGMS